MPDYTFKFLDIIGMVSCEKTLQVMNDKEAIEIAHLFDHPYGIRIFAGAREVGGVYFHQWTSANA